MFNRTWLQTIKLGKAKILKELNYFGIEHRKDENYFKLCSKVYQQKKARRQQILDVEAWADKVAIEAEYLGLRAKLENRYAKSVVHLSKNDVICDKLLLQHLSPSEIHFFFHFPPIILLNTA